ncbi:MAG: carbohydrate kinase family protein [Candidatus Hydrogenedentales bacterium]
MSSRSKGIIAIGHILVDGIGKATDAFSARWGNLPSPAHVPPALMEELCDFLQGGENETEVSWTMGGGVAIMAKAARALGTETEVWASVGRDEHGRFLARALAESGVGAHLLASEGSTGVFCSFSTESGGKRIIVSPGAARDIRGFEIPEAAFHPGWIFYIDGLLIDDMVWLSAQAKRAKKAGMKVAMDVSTASNAKAHRKALVEFANVCCDIVFANESEFIALGGLAAIEPDSGTDWVVKKAGKGASMTREGLWIDSAASRIDPIDDTGAGDVFSAGFLTALLRDFDAARCLRLGNAAAAATLRSRGSGFDPVAMKRDYNLAETLLIP